MQLIKALKDHRDSGAYPFHMPGHKRRLAPDEILEDIYGIDVTEIEGLDDLHDAKGIIKEAEDRAAECFGADETHFLVNGSTGGILAAITALVKEGDCAIIARNCHRSVYNAVMLSGAGLYVIDPEREKLFDIFGGIRPEDVQAAITKARDDNDGAGRVAVIITSPTYEGVTSDIASIAGICHKNGAVLIVDAAHGAHFSLSDHFPKSAQSLGADVVITSVHKTLPAMTQTAIIHIGRKCPAKDNIRKMLTVFMTSSPSYVLMSSIDSMSVLLEERGRQLFDGYEKRLDRFYGRMSALRHLSILGKEKLAAKGSADFDKSKIVISDTTGTYSGKALSDELRDRGLIAEMASDSYVVLMTSIADTDEGFERLADALEEIDAAITSEGKPQKEQGRDKTEIFACGAGMKTAMLSKEAKYVPLKDCEGMIAKDMVTVYPPGIPVTIPGRMIGREDIDELLLALNDGLEVKGIKDKEIAVLWEKSST